MECKQFYDDMDGILCGNQSYRTDSLQLKFKRGGPISNKTEFFFKIDTQAIKWKEERDDSPQAWSFLERPEIIA